MKRLIFLLALLPTLLIGQQNSKLAQNLLLSVQSGANALPGSNLVTNGTFDTDTDWTKSNATWTINTTTKTADYSASSNGQYIQGTCAITSGNTYVVTFTVKTGTAYIALYSQADVALGAWTDYTAHAVGSYSYTFKALASATSIRIYAIETAAFTIDNIVIRPIHSSALTLPNPAYTLSNSGAIPTYGHKSNNSYWSFDGVDDYLSVYVLNTGTDSYSISARIRVPLTSGNYVIFDGRDGGGDGIIFYIVSDGTIALVHNSIVTSSSTTISGNQWYTITASVTYGGTAKFYIDGTEVSYSAQPTINTSVSTTNSGTLAHSIDPASYKMDYQSFSIFNYALSEEDVTYYSNPANHLKAVDQGATGSNLITSWANDGTNPYDTFTSTADVITSAINTGGDDVANSNAFTAMVAGESYKLTTGLTLNSGTAPILYTMTSGYANITNLGVMPEGTTVYNITAVGSEARLKVYNGTATNYNASFSLIKLGCVLSLTPEGMLSQSLWRDYYHSTDIAVGTGSTAPRLVKDWAGMNAWRFSGASDCLLKSSASDGLTGDITISFWVFFNSYGDYAGAGRIFDNGQILIYTRNSTTGIAAFRDGSTGRLDTGATSINTWYHIVYTSTSSGNSKLYMNGTLVASGAQGTPVSSTTYRIGNNSDNNSTLNGVVESLKIYNRILSSEEIALSYAIYD